MKERSINRLIGIFVPTYVKVCVAHAESKKAKCAQDMSIVCIQHTQRRVW